ncbi:MAG: ABC transporter ATP-binding protein [Anaerolineae bacterium]|nr:ABC transporter ATP-binding protein [Anaerolineae bacterium]MDW8171535.1 ABC transporter ATP-binding protein [Anaerolineae bacterium]
MSDTLIEVTGLWKRYGFPLRPALRQARDRLLGRYDARSQAYGPWALRDVHLRVQRGESLGIIGRNGAGKSTLLKVLAGVTPPTRGSYAVHGSLFPMIELNAGLQPDLSGYENIDLLGAVMGLSRRAIRAKLPAIEAFSELGDWLKRPIRTYSSGMLARLGFSVAINVDAEILLIDEVLSVGDLRFQKKCLTRIDELASGGCTFVFISHSPYAVERVCDRAILLDQGQIIAEDSPGVIMGQYLRGINQSEDDAASVAVPERHGNGDVRLRALRLVDLHSGAPLDEVQTGQSFRIEMDVQVKRPVVQPAIGLRIQDSAGTVVLHLRHSPAIHRPIDLTEDCTLVCDVERLPLLPGPYWINFICKEGTGILIDHAQLFHKMLVTADLEVVLSTVNIGIAYARAQWDVQAQPQPQEA